MRRRLLFVSLLIGQDGTGGTVAWCGADMWAARPLLHGALCFAHLWQLLASFAGAGG